MMSPSAVDTSPEVLLLGKIDHARKEWEALGSIVHLRVSFILTSFTSFKLQMLTLQQEVTEGDRARFIKDCQNGVYDRVMAISRTFDSVGITGRFDAELLSHLPKSLRFVCHNGAGYDQIDAGACADRGSRAPSTAAIATI